MGIAEQQKYQNDNSTQNLEKKLRQIKAVLLALKAVGVFGQTQNQKSTLEYNEQDIKSQEQPQKQSSNVQQNHPKKTRKPTTKQTLRKKGRSALQTQRNRKVHNYQETLIPTRIERTWIESEVTGESGYSGKEYTYTETKYY